jgi:hypothetical protein
MRNIVSSESKATFVQDLRAKHGEAPFTSSKFPQDGSILYLRFGKGADTWIVTISYMLYPAQPKPVVTYGVSVRNPRDSYSREYGQAVAWMRRRMADETFLSGSRRAFWGSMYIEDTTAADGRKGVDRAVIAAITSYLSTDEKNVPMKLRLATAAALQEWAAKQQAKTLPQEEHAHV